MVNSAYVGCAVIFIFILSTAFGKQACDISTVVNRQCSPTETCAPSQDSKSGGFCECLPGHVRVNNTHCTNSTVPNDPPTPKSSSLVDDEGSNHKDGNGHVVAGVLIPIFLIMVVICAVYVSRKYNLVNYVRSKMYQRNSNYDEVMIGQDLDDDDPPLR